MIRGAVPGAKGGWVLLCDAVKRSLPGAAPKPGAFRKAAGDAPKQAKQDKDSEAEAPEASAEAASAEGGSQE
jgi:large subunit ribosomal protein L3